jgi:NCS1 family nucleobase:cation symporter-1
MMPLLVEDAGSRIVETGVPLEQQSMTLEKIFWSHFSPNFGPGQWIIGALLVGMGLNFWWGLLAIVVGNTLGGLPVALSAVMGPRTGLTQIEMSRFSFGRLGTRVPAALNYVTIVVWDAVSNVPAAIALIAIAALVHLAVPFWICLTLLVLVQMIAGTYGHHVVQILQKYIGYVMIVAFGVVGVVAVLHGGSPHPLPQPTIAMFLLGVTLTASNAISWAPYSSDYTRYAPRDTPPAAIIALSYVGLVLSSGSMQVLGLLTAAHIVGTSPEALIASIVAMTGAFAPVALIAVTLSAISGNAVNDNTASYSLISSGVKIARPLAATITGILGFIVAIAGEGAFAQLFSNYLVVLLYWVAPWMGIMLADWYWRGEPQPGRVLRWGSGATIFIVVLALTIALFASSPTYTGPIAKALGGLDIGYLVGFFAAGLIAIVVMRNERAPRTDRAALEPT